MGSDGLLSTYQPDADDDRQDILVRLRQLFTLTLAFQVKSALEVRHPWRANLLHIRFTVKKEHLTEDPYFYYLLAFLDPRIMRFADPVFIVPSHVFHGPGHPTSA
jgi:hypothetical protein